MTGPGSNIELPQVSYLPSRIQSFVPQLIYGEEGCTSSVGY